MTLTVALEAPRLAPAVCAQRTKTVVPTGGMLAIAGNLFTQ